MDKQELIKLLDITNQRIRHHHDALWKEETHYTWLVYIITAGVVFIAFASPACWILKASIITTLGIIGSFICYFAYRVVRREGQFSHEALQIRNRLNCAIGLNQPIKIEPNGEEIMIPTKDTEIKDWNVVESKANKPLGNLVKGVFKPGSMDMGIRDWFQITLLLPVLLFVSMIILSITKAFCP